MRQKDKEIIRCPCCGYEYTLPEIFDPEDVFGKITNIMRDDNNKILLYSYDDDSEPKRSQLWTCDGCGSTFYVKLNVEAEVEYNIKNDFSEEWSTGNEQK